MYARINYVDIKPEAFDEVDKFWHDVVSGYEGLVQGVFLRDGTTPHTLSIVVFETEQFMNNNTQNQLGKVVEKASSHRLNEPELHPLEVCAHVDGNPGDIKCARVANVTLKVDRMDRIIDNWAPEVSQYGSQSGFLGGLMCADRFTGEVRSVTYWATEDDMQENEASGAFNKAVGPYEDAIAVAPLRTYWNARVVV